MLDDGFLFLDFVDGDLKDATYLLNFGLIFIFMTASNQNKCVKIQPSFKIYSIYHMNLMVHISWLYFKDYSWLEAVMKTKINR